eukprot:1159559-Pelagomonas_calceolata.AAC.1
MNTLQEGPPWSKGPMKTKQRSNSSHLRPPLCLLNPTLLTLCVTKHKCTCAHHLKLKFGGHTQTHTHTRAHIQGERRPPLPTTHKLPILTFSAKEAGVALVASLLRKKHGRIEPVERASVQPKGRSYSRTLFARGASLWSLCVFVYECVRAWECLYQSGKGARKCVVRNA